MRNHVHGYFMLVILVSVQLWIKEYEKSCAWVPHVGDIS